MKKINDMLASLLKYFTVSSKFEKSSEMDVDKLSIFERLFYNKTEQEQRLLDKYEERTNKTCFKSKRYIERGNKNIYKYNKSIKTFLFYRNISFNF